MAARRGQGIVASGGDAGGLWGLGVITEFSETRQLRMRALPPTETLQATPRWSPKVRRLVAEVPATADEAMCESGRRSTSGP